MAPPGCIDESCAVVAIAASAGGVFALLELFGSFTSGPPVPTLVVQHLSPRHRTVLDTVLQRRTRVPVKLAQDGERAAAGRVYLAPPDRHLLIEPDGTLRLADTARVNRVRPAADRLFTSLAEHYGQRAWVFVLSGTGRDGAQGAQAVKDRGGTVVVQDPDTAEYPGMPEAALKAGAVDHILPLHAIETMLRSFAHPAPAP
ncbi:chemotaxis protein [Streptomyces rimosus subsp. pseudoverticillatus]|uniref:chemotaxis protein CheB n=1 Tax=Streptomyces rimosus TaxID=1927 RepID=UPI0006B260AB|nr:chemotaxis protein CheB [Streptomyces rimosus]KOT84637.1 chemotaxis protein [Streptomyces rimosus subsp. pseudoverticillatus]